MRASVTIAGAGLAGLLAANLLHRFDPLIVERQLGLPNNHSAVLRFRSGAVGEALGIPFREVTMIKAALPVLNPVADALNYAHKCLGERRSDRSLPLEPVSAQRFIAPRNLIERMAEGLRIQYGETFLGAAKGGPSVSTIPMPVLMSLLNYPRRKEVSFEFRSGINIIAKAHFTDAFATIYNPDPATPWSRASVTGDELSIEFPGMRAIPDEPRWITEMARSAASCLGLNSLVDIEARAQEYAKIMPIDEGLRRDFIYWASDQHNVFSLGRFATWRPGLLLDDLLRDISLISGWLESGPYAARLHR